MEKDNFLFSIIVPVYNTEKYIEKCLSSIEKAMEFLLLILCVSATFHQSDVM